MSREWYPWFPRRFWSSERVALMDDAAVALYKFLLDHEWENGPFSSDERVIRALCARFKSFDTSWPQVRPCFDQTMDGRLSNRRMEKERSMEREASSARAARSKNAWTKRREAFDADAEHMQSTSIASEEHVESTQPATDGRTDHTDGQTGGAGEPAPKARKRADLDHRKVLAEYPQINTPAVAAALDEYFTGRRERRQKAQTARGLRIGLNRLAPFSPDAARDAILEAAGAGWLSFFEPKAKNGHAHKNGHDSGRSIPAYVPEQTPRNQNPPRLAELLAAQRRATQEAAT